MVGEGGAIVYNSNSIVEEVGGGSGRVELRSNSTVEEGVGGHVVCNCDQTQ